MASADPPNAVARIIAAHRPAPPVLPDRSPDCERVFGRALRHAASAFPALGLTIRAVQFSSDQDLSAAIDALSDTGLCAGLEDDAGRRGLISISAGLIDALVEVQTTGRVDATSLPPRPVTEIDLALSRDYIDLALAAFAREVADLALRDWPDRFRFGSRIADRRQINLLLPDCAYHVFRADLTFEKTDREAEVICVVPVDPTLLASHAAGDDPTRGGAEATWRAGLRRVLLAAPVAVEAQLVQVTRPLGVVQRLKPGDLIPLSAEDIDKVTLIDPDGRKLASGRLGQIDGKRALRLQTGQKTAASTEVAGLSGVGLEAAAPALDPPQPMPVADPMVADMPLPDPAAPPPL